MRRGYDDTATIDEVARLMAADTDLSRRQAILSVLPEGPHQASNLRRIEMKMAKASHVAKGVAASTRPKAPRFVLEILAAIVALNFLRVPSDFHVMFPLLSGVMAFYLVAWSFGIMATTVKLSGRARFRGAAWVGGYVFLAFALAQRNEITLEDNSLLYACGLTVIAGGIAGFLAADGLRHAYALSWTRGSVSAVIVFAAFVPPAHVGMALSKTTLSHTKALAAFSTASDLMRGQGIYDQRRQWESLRNLQFALRETPFGQKFNMGEHLLDFELWMERDRQYSLCRKELADQRSACINRVAANTKDAFPPPSRYLPLKVALFGA